MNCYPEDGGSSPSDRRDRPKSRGERAPESAGESVFELPNPGGVGQNQETIAVMRRASVKRAPPTPTPAVDSSSSPVTNGSHGHTQLSPRADRIGTSPLKIRARTRPKICTLDLPRLIRHSVRNPCLDEAFGKEKRSNVGDAPADSLCHSGFLRRTILWAGWPAHMYEVDGSVLFSPTWPGSLPVSPGGHSIFYTQFRHLMDRHHG